MFECKRQKAKYPYMKKKGYFAFWKRKKGTLHYGTPLKGYFDISLLKNKRSIWRFKLSKDEKVRYIIVQFFTEDNHAINWLSVASYASSLPHHLQMSISMDFLKKF